MKIVKLLWLLITLNIIGCIARAEPPIIVEDLGQPFMRRSLGMRCLTHDAAGMREAWASFESHDKFALVGVRLDNGRTTWVDLNPFGEPPARARHVQMISAA